MKIYNYECILKYALEKGPDRFSPYDLPIEDSTYMLNRPYIMVERILIPFDQEGFEIKYSEFENNICELSATKDDIQFQIKVILGRCKAGVTLEDSTDRYTYRPFNYFWNPCWELFETVVNGVKFYNEDDVFEYFYELSEKEDI